MTMRRVPRRTRRRTDSGAHRTSFPALSFPALSFPALFFPAVSCLALSCLAPSCLATPIGWRTPTR